MDYRDDVHPDLGFLGTWAWDAGSGLIQASDQVNVLFGFGLDVQSGLDISAYEARIHPDDLDWLRHEHPRCFGASGQGMVQYRVVDDAGAIHWVMSNGLYARAPDGTLESAHGMMIDVTKIKADGNDVRTAPAPVADPMQLTADTLMRAHQAAVQTGNAQLQFEIELALATVGRALAKNLTVVGRQARLDT